MPDPRNVMYPSFHAGDPLVASTLQDIASLSSRTYTGHVTASMSSEASGVATSQDPPAGFWARVTDSTHLRYYDQDAFPHMQWQHAFTEQVENLNTPDDTNPGNIIGRFKDRPGGVTGTLTESPLYESQNRRIIDGAYCWCVKGTGNYYLTTSPPPVVPVLVMNGPLVTGPGGQMFYPGKTALYLNDGNPPLGGYDNTYFTTNLDTGVGAVGADIEGLVDCLIAPVNGGSLVPLYYYTGVFSGYNEDLAAAPSHTPKKPVFLVNGDFDTSCGFPGQINLLDQHLGNGMKTVEALSVGVCAGGASASGLYTIPDLGRLFVLGTYSGLVSLPVTVSAAVALPFKNSYGDVQAGVVFASGHGVDEGMNVCFVIGDGLETVGVEPFAGSGWAIGTTDASNELMIMHRGNETDDLGPRLITGKLCTDWDTGQQVFCLKVDGPGYGAFSAGTAASGPLGAGSAGKWGNDAIDNRFAGGICYKLSDHVVQFTGGSPPVNGVGIKGNLVEDGTKVYYYDGSVWGWIRVVSPSYVDPLGAGTSGTDASGNVFVGGVLTTIGGGPTIPPPAGSAPAASGSAGTAGQIAYDSSFFYVCTATNTWKRVSLSSF